MMEESEMAAYDYFNYTDNKPFKINMEDEGSINIGMNNGLIKLPLLKGMHDYVLSKEPKHFESFFLLKDGNNSYRPVEITLRDMREYRALVDIIQTIDCDINFNKSVKNNDNY